jgi:hypothetical protein
MIEPRVNPDDVRPPGPGDFDPDRFQLTTCPGCSVPLKAVSLAGGGRRVLACKNKGCELYDVVAGTLGPSPGAAADVPDPPPLPPDAAGRLRAARRHPGPEPVPDFDPFDADEVAEMWRRAAEEGGDDDGPPPTARQYDAHVLTELMKYQLDLLADFLKGGR